MRSASFESAPERCVVAEFPLRRPRSLANAESLATKVWAAAAHLEFLRMVDVTASISESKTCLNPILGFKLDVSCTMVIGDWNLNMLIY